jgi:hypothetical protein
MGDIGGKEVHVGAVAYRIIKQRDDLSINSH